MAFSSAVTSTTALVIVFGTCLWYIIGLYLHPLAKFPGPKIAALTQLYEFYHDVVRPGQYTWVIRSMHQRYGPIVRISPYELHIDDPAFYDELYSGATKPREKWSFTANMFGIPTAALSTIGSDLHRARRAPLNHLFSKRSVVQLSPAITKHVEKLCERIAEFRGSNRPLSLRYAYSAVALDVVTDYAFAQPYGALDDPAFGRQWADAVHGMTKLTYMNMYFPWMPTLLKKMPPWVVKLTNPPLLKVIEFQLGLRDQILAIMKDPGDEKYKADGHATVFHELLSSSELPVSDRNLAHFTDEAQAIVAAGQVTTAYHLNCTSFHILANPDILKSLKQELENAMPDPGTLLPLEKLEQLEYLNAVVHEGHRMSHGATHRLQRVSPETPIIYNDWTIPTGTPVGMSGLLLHENVDIFPSPHTFDPSRFLGPGGQKRRKYLVHFSRGTRNCLGQNLGNAELFLTLAAVFRRFDFKVHETQREDIDVAYDYVTPLPRKGSKGLRVLVG